MPDTPARDDNETTSNRCPICSTPFTAIRRQRYCTNACRQIAYRRRHHPPEPTIELPPGSQRENTVYACDECDQRYHAQQWCPDCQRPCRRIGPGGTCPHCDEPVAVQELFNPPGAAMNTT